jgi:predicted enzyme related to lactoylglutathione lyase
MPAMEAIGSFNGLVIDGADTFALAGFWSALMGTEIDEVANDGHYIDLEATGHIPVLRFQRVPETKTIKNRLHLDIEVEDLEGSIARVRELGGSVVHDMRTEYGWDYVVLADPEGNEFCAIKRNAARSPSD